MWDVYFITVFLWIWPKEEHNFEEDLGTDGKGETTLDRLDCERCHFGRTEKVQSSLTQCLGRLHRQISNSITLVQTLFIFRYILFLIYALLHRLLRDLECSLYSAARNAVISICSSPKMKRQFQSLQWQGESASEKSGTPWESHFLGPFCPDLSNQNDVKNTRLSVWKHAQLFQAWKLNHKKFTEKKKTFKKLLKTSHHNCSPPSVGTC